MKKKPLALWDRDSQPAAPGLDQLLPTHAEQRDLGGTRYVDAASLSAVAAVEASTDPAAQIVRTGCGRRTGLARGDERSRSLVERGCSTLQPRLTGGLLYALGAGLVTARAAATPVCLLNRRMRNRTYGGVGGR